MNDKNIKKKTETKRVFFQSKFNVQTSHYLIDYNIFILHKSFPVNNILVTKCVSVLFPTFSNANDRGKALTFDAAQNCWEQYVQS